MDNLRISLETLVTLETLVAARALLARPWGWCKGSFEREQRGVRAYCALGAIRAVNAADPHKAELALEAVVGDVIPVFNDAPGTRKNDVLAAFDKAIERVSNAA